MINRKALRSLDIIFNIFIVTQILFGFILFYLLNSGTIEPVFSSFKFMPLVVLAINSTIILSAKYLFTKRSKIDKKLSLGLKVSKYKELTLAILAILHSANIINLIVYLFDGSTIYLIVAALILVLFFVYRPSPDKFAEDTLTQNEKEQFLAEQIN